jgi:hypothetical protein
LLTFQKTVSFGQKLNLRDHEMQRQAEYEVFTAKVEHENNVYQNQF